MSRDFLYIGCPEILRFPIIKQPVIHQNADYSVDFGVMIALNKFLILHTVDINNGVGDAEYVNRVVVRSLLANQGSILERVNGSSEMTIGLRHWS